MEAIHRGEIKALLSICFNPLVSLPDANYVREALEKLEFFGVIDFFLSETAHHADVVLAGSLQEEEEGVVCQRRGPGHPHPEGGDSAGRRVAGQPDLLRAGAAAGQGAVLPVPHRRARSSTSCARPRAAAPPTTTGITYEKIDRADGGLLALPDAEDHPGTPRLFEGGRFFHPGRQGPLPGHRVASQRRSGRRGVPDLPHHRPAW